MTDGPVKLLLNIDWPQLLEAARTIPNVEPVMATENEDVLREIADADAAGVGLFDAEMLAAGKRLRWVHAFSGGVGGFLFPQMLASPVLLTSSKGTFHIVAAEHAIGHMLLFTRRIYHSLLRKASRDYGEYDDGTELAGKTLGIIGLGSMGRELARKAGCLEMKVIGLARRPEIPAPGVEHVYGPGQLAQMLPQCDFVGVAVPATPQTKGMIGRAELEAMRPSAYLIDLSGRDAIYDLDALCDALRDKSIAGASLQVRPPEDSPLWDMDNYIYSFTRTTSDECIQRVIDLFRENLSRFVSGRDLLSVVDKELGY